MDEFDITVDLSGQRSPSSHAAHRPQRSYAAPGLALAPGRVRTYALAVMGVPLLLVVLALQPWSALGGGSVASPGRAADGPAGGAAQGGAGPNALSPPPIGGEPAAPPAGSSSAATPWTTPAGTPTASEPAAADQAGGPPSGTDSSSAASSPSGTPGPDSTVTSYYAAINRGDFQTAWNLGGKNLDPTYSAFVSGFADTEHDTVSIVSVQGNDVSVNLASRQKGGRSHTYSGTYTVIAGVITAAHMRQTG